MIATIAGLAVGQIAAHLDMTLPDDLADGEHVTLGVRSVRPDSRSSYDPSFRWPWPGGWTPRVDADPSDRDCSFGLHVARGWRGLSATGPVHMVQVVAYRPADVAHTGPYKLRVSQAAVVDLIDVHRMARNRYLWGADLRGADLTGADLTGADLTDANLSDARLSGADLSDANLSDADLSGADLTGADLSDARLSGADLSDANLSDARLSGARLSDANLYDARWSPSTVWPTGYNPGVSA